MPLHPIITRIIRQAYAKGHANLHQQSLADVRSHYAKNFSPPKGQSGENHHAKNCLLRLHRPVGISGALPVIIYLRASGYSLGSIADADYFCEQLAKYTQCIVVAMEPRLSPEYRFPIPIQDCLDGLYYLHHYSQSLGIISTKIAIWGESSGGSYAAALCQLVKHQGLIAQQVLVYPMLDYFNHYPSKQTYGKGYLMDNTLTAWFLTNYARGPSDFADPLVSPVLAEDFCGLPPTLIIGAQCDPMRDESLYYYQKLHAAAVSVKAVYFLGVTHGFLWYSHLLDSARIALHFAADQLLLGFKGQEAVVK